MEMVGILVLLFVSNATILQVERTMNNSERNRKTKLFGLPNYTKTVRYKKSHRKIKLDHSKKKGIFMVISDTV